MRFAFGLVGLLVTCLIMAIIWATYNKPVADAAKKITPQAQQIAGVSPGGIPGGDTASFKAVEQDGRLVAEQVLTVNPDGPMATYYGLMPGDVIKKLKTPAGEYKIGESPYDDPSFIRHTIGEDGPRQQFELTVDRGGTLIILPAVPGATPSPTPAAANATPTNNTPAKAPVASQQPAQQPQPSNPSTPSGNPNHTARGQAEDLLNKLNAAQNRGE